MLNADLGIKNQAYNWYGLQPGLFTENQIASIDEKQTYTATLTLAPELN
jgi:hypothetical protein